MATRCHLHHRRRRPVTDHTATITAVVAATAAAAAARRNTFCRGIHQYFRFAVPTDLSAIQLKWMQTLRYANKSSAPRKYQALLQDKKHEVQAQPQGNAGSIRNNVYLRMRNSSAPKNWARRQNQALDLKLALKKEIKMKLHKF